jgi:hypothetical protein
MPDLGNGWVPVVLTSRPGMLTFATVPLMCPAALPYFVPAQISEVQVGEPACRPGPVQASL